MIDEFSMVDTLLFSNLLSASRKVSKILLIGDDQQLPSVAPGHVLKDLLDCEMVPTVRLNRIYRQSQESGIVQLAHSIRNDQYDENLFFEYKDIHFQTCASYDVVKYVQVLVSKAMKEGYDANDIQVLAPMYNGCLLYTSIYHVIIYHRQSSLKKLLTIVMKITHINQILERIQMFNQYFSRKISLQIKWMFLLIIVPLYFYCSSVIGTAILKFLVIQFSFQWDYITLNTYLNFLVDSVMLILVGWIMKDTMIEQWKDFKKNLKDLSLIHI